MRLNACLSVRYNACKVLNEDLNEIIVVVSYFFKLWKCQTTTKSEEMSLLKFIRSETSMLFAISVKGWWLNTHVMNE